MDREKVKKAIEQIIHSIEKKIPRYLKQPEDFNLNGGNASLCLIDEEGNVYGKMFGTDMIRKRSTYKTAWKKASQVWITKTATGKFEELVYTKKVSLKEFGLMNPELIGWEGGLPVQIDGNTMIAAGFSGFRGTSDCEIIRVAVKEVLGIDI